jgi:2,4-dienoyl-CoA reductase-like NADH-dependent reductase (Old Yellow Enzyme family)
MNHYDPFQAPDAGQWLALDEQERISLVEKYHKKARIALPNRLVHASMHAVVENQLAQGLPVVQEALSRLMAEGLDRHDAIHAIASVVASQIWHALRDKPPSGDISERYFQTLRTFTAADWRKKAQED